MTHRRSLDLVGRAAVELARNGWPVIPLERGGKRPLLSGWRSLGITPVERVQEWWTYDYPGANVGVLTGRIVVVDVDAKKGGLKSYKGLDLPLTLTVRTGGGGLHLYFTVKEGVSVGNRVDLVPGVDLRGEGGLVVAPPSIHASGRLYRWDIRTPEMAMLPDHLMGLGVDREELRAFTASIIAGCGPQALESEAASVRNAPEGTRNDQLNRSAYTLGAYVRMKELTRHEVTAALTAAARVNGLGEEEIEATIRSGLRAGAA